MGRCLDLTIEFALGPEPMRVLGVHERNVRLLREGLGVSVTPRGDVVRIRGPADRVRAAERVLRELAQSGRELTRGEVVGLLARESGGGSGTGPGIAGGRRGDEVFGQGEGGEGVGGVGGVGGGWEGGLSVYAGGRQIRARTPGQAAYLDAIASHELTFGIGPAGTGKTYLAVAAAVHMLRTDMVRKLVLVRPAVEAGERLGFLPGDVEAKVHPYLRPLLDALYDMMDPGTMERFLGGGVVEIAPLGFMRGRTLNQAAILLDEAQNTTVGQMQMFLTRMGEGSRMIVTGDATQIDLPDPAASGLVDAARRLRRVPGVAFVTLGRADVVRHKLVQRIIEAYGGEREGERDATPPAGGEGSA